MAASDDTGEWPVDPDGEEGSHGGRRYGMRVIADKLSDEDFPFDVAAFVEEYGDYPVRINHRRVVSVADVFEHVEGDGFEDRTELFRAVGDAMRRGEFWDFTPER